MPFKINSLRDLSPKTLIDLKAWLEPWMLKRVREVVGGTGFIRFDFDNQGGYLDIQTNDTDADGYGIHINDETGDNGMLIEAEEQILLQQNDGSARIVIYDLISGDRGITIDAGLDQTNLYGTGINAHNQELMDLMDGAAPQSAATVSQLTAATDGGIRYEVTPQVGGWLDIEANSADVDGYGVQIVASDSTAGGAGVKVESTFGQVEVSGADGVLLYVPFGGGGVVRVDTVGVEAALVDGTTFKVTDSAAATILSTNEGTGVTTGTFDGGSP